MNKNSSNNEMKITDTVSQAQSDMSKDYANGSVGMIVSGLIRPVSVICF